MTIQEIFYLPVVEKPSMPPGIDYASRLAAYHKLLAYHQDPRFPDDSEDYYFRDVTRFLQVHPPNPAIDVQDLLQFVSNHQVTNDDYDTNSLEHLRMLGGLVKESKTLSSTCPYRTVTAAVIGRVHFGDTYVNIGGVGTNGGHEYTHIDPDCQVGMLAQMITECLIVTGIPITSEEAPQRELVETIAKRIIEARLERPYVRSPHCMDFSSLARAGAQEYLVNSGMPQQVTPDFNGCLMNRLNRRAYAAIGLNPPPQLGRKNCISACAEQNALMKEKEAANIARLLPVGENDAVYLIGQDRSHFVNRETGTIVPATHYTYYVYRENTADLAMKSIMVDERLLWHPVSGKNSDNMIRAGPVFTPAMRERFFRSADSYFERTEENVSVYVGGDGEQSYPDSGIKTQQLVPLIDVPLDDIPQIQQFQIKPVSLYTTGLPCLYCTKAIIENRVMNTYVDDRLEQLKGDDGLSLEYLASVYEGEMRFC
ncbi:hypothetical protein HY468_05250 [Candidatus Roizmanbacteria bacterium]|nr:hypothetical protein [Candidatus Roizmanbacteria bacterium]